MIITSSKKTEKVVNDMNFNAKLVKYERWKKK